MESGYPCRRRTFLGVSAVGAVALPTAITRAALGQQKIRPPSERVAIAFIGPGRRGAQLVREFAGRHDVEPLAVCDVRRSQREKMAQLVEELAGKRRSFSGCRRYADFRDVLDRQDIEGVVIAAPEHWRGIMCIMSAHAGKDIFTEKPFALTIREAREMVAAIRRFGRIFQHGTQRRSNNEWKLRDSCELVRSGRIGQVTHAVVPVGPAPMADYPDYQASTRPPNPEEFDWDMWLGPAPWRPYEGMQITSRWQRVRDFGLRSIGNWGSHTLDMAQWALGKDAEGPVEIAPATESNPELVFTYADGVQIRCPRTGGDAAMCSVYGTKGRKHIFGNVEIKEEYDRTPLGSGDTLLYRPKGNDHNGNWLRGIRTRRKTICNEEVGYRSGSLVLLIALADRLQRKLSYDPVKGEFRGDAQANRLLDTPTRAPWRAY